MSTRALRVGTGRRPGRPSKGDRHPHTIYFPAALYADLKNAATDAGYGGLTEYVTDIVARAQAAGLWPTQTPGQERLPISA